MKLMTDQVYYSDNGDIKIQYSHNDYDLPLNLTGYLWLDTRYGLVKSLLLKDCGRILVTDTDLLAHDDYISCLNLNQTIYFVLAPSGKNTKYCGASKKRLKNAINKLKERGFKIRFFASVLTLENQLKRLSNKRKGLT